MVIVPVRIPFMSLPERNTAFVERVIPRREFTLPPDVAAMPEPPLEMPPAESSTVLLGVSF
jgi:hypothetical protein